MTQYAKLVDDILEFAPKNKGSIINYDLDVEQMIIDGYKLFVPIEEFPITNRLFHIGYIENTDNIEEIIVYEETQEEADRKEAEDRKRNKTQEINEKIAELNSMLINELRKGNKQNIDVYNEVISGLEEMRDNL